MTLEEHKREYYRKYPELKDVAEEDINWLNIALDNDWFPELTRWNKRYVRNNIVLLVAFLIAAIASAVLYFVCKGNENGAQTAKQILAVVIIVFTGAALMLAVHGNQIKKKAAPAFEEAGFMLR